MGAVAGGIQPCAAVVGSSSQPYRRINVVNALALRAALDTCPQTNTAMSQVQNRVPIIVVINEYAARYYK